ncbi:MAG: hypothetical protein JWN08_1924, partial [Frankiales bacterium]|nr:hypothetical protein [Frankiales bacterium]
SGTGWRTVAAATSGPDGRVRVGAPLARGTVVRLHSPARTALLAGTSPARTAPQPAVGARSPVTR